MRKILITILIILVVLDLSGFAYLKTRPVRIPEKFGQVSITYVGSSSNPADNGTGADASTYAVDSYNGSQAGDLIIMVGAMQAEAAGAITISEAGGQTWSTLSEYVAAGLDMMVAVYWTQLVGELSASVSLAFASQSGTQPVVAVQHIFRPSVVGTWIADTAIFGEKASNSPDVISGITPTKKDNLVLAGWAISNVSTWGTLAGTGWNTMTPAYYRNTSGSDQSVTFAYQTQANPAFTNNVSQNPSTATTGAQFTMAWSAQVAPTTTIDTPDNNATGVSVTPDLLFTGTDTNTDEVEYEVQVDTAVGFDSVKGGDTQTTDNTIGGYVQGGTGGSGESYQAAGQTINPTNSFTLTSVKLKISKTANPVDNLSVSVHTTSETGTNLGTSSTVNGADIGTGTICTFTFSSGILLSSGTTYYFVIERSGARDTTNYYGTRDVNLSAFAGGVQRVKSNNSWADLGTGGYDIYFDLYPKDAPLLDILSSTEDPSHFAGTGSPSPFPSGNQVTYSVQAAAGLTASTDYYWRVRAKDASGSNTFGAWSLGDASQGYNKFTTAGGAGWTGAGEIIDSPPIIIE